MTHHRCCVTALSGLGLLWEKSSRFKIHKHMDNSAIKERESFLSKAEAYIDRNLYKEAMQIAESWLDRFPTDADAHIIRCHALLRMGNLEKVHEILNDVENMVLQLSRIYNRVGDLCLKGGLTREAIKFYQKFVSLNPESPITKDVSEKISALISIVDASSRINQKEYSDSDHVASDFYTTTLDELYMTRGHIDMAADVLTEILRREPDNELVAARLKEIRAMQDDRIRGETSILISQNEKVVQELTRWLKNIDRLKSYAP